MKHEYSYSLEASQSDVIWIARLRIPEKGFELKSTAGETEEEAYRHLEDSVGGAIDAIQALMGNDMLSADLSLVRLVFTLFTVKRELLNARWRRIASD